MGREATYSSEDPVTSKAAIHAKNAQENLNVEAEGFLRKIGLFGVRGLVVQADAFGPAQDRVRGLGVWVSGGLGVWGSAGQQDFPS